jgi:ABC-type ATPase involved in cell division
MKDSTALVLETPGFVFEHQGRSLEVPPFHLAPGEVLGLQLPHSAATEDVDVESSTHDGADDGAADDLGDSLLGLAPLTRGSVRLFGADVASTSRTELMALRRRVAFAPLRPAFLSTVTVPDNVAIPLRDREDPPDAALMEAVHAKLAALSVPIVGRVLPGQLAPRARYLAGVARALLAPSELLIIAVPEVPLARELASTLRDELRVVRERGTALLVLGRSRAHSLAGLDTVHHVRALAQRAEPSRRHEA